MFIDNKENRKLVSRWIVGIFTACIIIYLGAGHMNTIGKAFLWLFNLLFPLFLGSIFALVLNVPMQFIEKKLFSRNKGKRLQKIRRPFAVLLSLLLILGIVIGIAFLIIPELMNAIGVIIATINDGMDQLAIMNKRLDWSTIPYGEQLSKIEINWAQIKLQLQQWLITISNSVI
ncbi:MAG: AI-2E family transporter, partial [Lachnospiraceae bacterium]|nr:AI-2E family transporter [Lachnospiraceae bacterium]